MSERVVVVGSGNNPDDPWWDLPPSRVMERPWIFGGERSLYELAFALAAGGNDVELRGNISAGVFDELARATAAHPRVDLPPRRPMDEIVVISEGLVEPWAVGRVALSRARVVLLLLAPPGLFGWPFSESWEPPDPMSVDIGTLARPEQFQAVAGLGFEPWTQSNGIVAAAHEAGVACTWIGTGSPAPFPPIPRKTHDVAVVKPNRWSRWADEVVAGLPPAVSVLETSEGGHDDIVAQIARARVLVWPSRIEGHARIQCEARAMGTVPVALDSNRFAADLDEEHGAVVVGSLDEMRHAIVNLLSDEGELERLSRLGEVSARAAVDWSGYVRRANSALERMTSRSPTRNALAGIGSAIADVVTKSAQYS
jgi:hypothetical protein